jgi:hypothetical protein
MRRGRPLPRAASSLSKSGNNYGRTTNAVMVSVSKLTVNSLSWLSPGTYRGFPEPHP